MRGVLRGVQPATLRRLRPSVSTDVATTALTYTHVTRYIRANGTAPNTTGTAGEGSSSSSNTNEQQIPATPASSAKHSDDAAAASNGSIFSAIKEEFGKLFRFVAHDVSKTAKASAESVKSYADTMTDANLSEEEKEKRRKKAEAYQTIMNKNAQKMKEAEAAKTANMSWPEKLQHNIARMKQATSKEQGVAALVQHCAAAHQAEVAVEQGIDVEDIQIVLEQVKKQDGIGFETKVVGYIDAPKASEEQVYAFAERLKQKCPAANMMQASMDWRKKGGREDPNSSFGDVSGSEDGPIPLGSEDPLSSSYSSPPRSRFASSEPRPGNLSGREYMNATRHFDDEAVSSNSGGFSASAFPSSFKNRNRFNEDYSHHSPIGKKGGLDNPFERLKILKEEPHNSEGSTSHPTSGGGGAGNSGGNTASTDTQQQQQPPKP